jgi:hypothetical protein
MFQNKVPFLIFVLFLLSCCSQSLPEQMPDLGISNNQLEFNSYINLTAPKQLNSYKPGKSVSLEVKNLSDKVWNFSITKDILIYQYENNEWKKVSDIMTTIGKTESTLGPKGSFPLDGDIVGVLPDVKLDQSTTLRIIILFHEKFQEQDGHIKGAYTDVVLRP